ncbi:MAG TPA: C40 family peptidase [Bacteroidia bacterium]|nr:C40 family peptidase [Bacteroidia bacterium]
MRILYLAAAMLLFTGRITYAQLSADGEGEDVVASDPITANLKGYYSQLFSINQLYINDFNLYNTLEPWLGIPYSYGGKSAAGIDCSGFVNAVLKGAYGIDITANSADLYKQSGHIKKGALEEGDLVFFRIRHRSVSHVGIYLGDGRFIHASTRNGVIVSSLDSPYYKRYFAGGGRLNRPAN